MNLPIDVIGSSSPPRFRWRQVVETPVGKRTQEYDGVLPPNLESAVEALVMIAKQLDKENTALIAENKLLKSGRPVAATPPNIAKPAPVVPIKK